MRGPPEKLTTPLKVFLVFLVKADRSLAQLLLSFATHGQNFNKQPNAHGLIIGQSALSVKRKNSERLKTLPPKKFSENSHYPIQNRHFVPIPANSCNCFSVGD
jgi:hypothetical protein